MLLFTLMSLWEIVQTDWDSCAHIFLDTPEGNRLALSRNWAIISTVCCWCLALPMVAASRSKYGMSPQALEICVSGGICLLQMFMLVQHPWYLTKLAGIDDPTPHLTPRASPWADDKLMLVLDLVLTAGHIAVPLRWVALIPLEVTTILCYAVPALALGSLDQSSNAVLNNIVIMAALTFATTCGKLAAEKQERSSFAQVAAERTLRAQAEHELCRSRGEDRQRRSLLAQQDAASSVPEGTSVAETSVVDTLQSASLPGFHRHYCTRKEMAAAFREGAPHLGLPGTVCPQSLATLLSVLDLLFDTAVGGALVCVADPVAFRWAFDQQGGIDSQASAAGPVVQSSDDGYMTNRLKGIHVSDERFAVAVREFTAHSDSDRWPEDHPDEAARGRPKDGAFLLSSSGYRVKCAAKLLGLPPAAAFPNAGTKHQAALACASAVSDSFVFVRSDSGALQLVFKRHVGLCVCTLCA